MIIECLNPKEGNIIKDRILRDIKHLYKYEEEENYYKPVRVEQFLE